MGLKNTGRAVLVINSSGTTGTIAFAFASISLPFPHSTRYSPPTIKADPTALHLINIHPIDRSSTDLLTMRNEKYVKGIKRASLIYLPRKSFSSRIPHPSIATMTSNSGLNIDTKSGPLLWMHHDINANANPDPTTPYLFIYLFKQTYNWINKPTS